jgi:Fur family ferric uptake transcriptional regulator
VIEIETRSLKRIQMDEREAFEEYLARRNLRVTGERMIVLREIMKAPGHVDIEYLVERLRKQKKPVSRATIYRTLTHLVDSGLVQKILTGEGQARYEKMFGRPHHDHMICLGCGEIIEFTNDEIERLQDWVCRRRNFRIVSHTLQIKGFCSKCAVRAHPQGTKAR